MSNLYTQHPLAVAEEIRAQERANAEKPSTAWVYPRSEDEPKLVETVRLSSENLNDLAQARPSDLATALKSMYAFNIEQYNQSCRLRNRYRTPPTCRSKLSRWSIEHPPSARWVSPPSPWRVISGAAHAAAGLPDIMNRLNFEIGRSYASLGNATAARNQYTMVR